MSRYTRSPDPTIKITIRDRTRGWALFEVTSADTEPRYRVLFSKIVNNAGVICRFYYVDVRDGNEEAIPKSTVMRNEDPQKVILKAIEYFHELNAEEEEEEEEQEVCDGCGLDLTDYVKDCGCAMCAIHERDCLKLVVAK